MTAELTQILVSVTTITMSGVVSAVVTYRLNARRQEREYLRHKLETLYMSMKKYCMILGTHFLNYHSVMVGKLTWDQANERTNEQGVDEERPYDNATMLVGIYFPEIQEHLDKLLAWREKTNDIVAAFKREYLKGRTESREAHLAMGVMFDELSVIEENMFAAIRATANKII